MRPWDLLRESSQDRRPTGSESRPQGFIVESPLHMHVAQSENVSVTSWGIGTAVSKSALFLRLFAFIRAGTSQVEMWSHLS